MIQDKNNRRLLGRRPLLLLSQIHTTLVLVMAMLSPKMGALSFSLKVVDMVMIIMGIIMQKVKSVHSVQEKKKLRPVWLSFSLRKPAAMIL